MLDHVFTDAIGALRDALETALLERQALEEHFQTDVLLGDTTWETSYGLPGEGTPPRIRTDLTLVWPTWAQTAYRTWFLDEEFTEGPRIEMEVVFRIQQVADAIDPAPIASVLPPPPTVGSDSFEPAGCTTETVYRPDLSVDAHAIEIAFHGSYQLSEETLEDGSALDAHFGSIGGWIAAGLVRLGDLDLTFQTEPD